MNRFKPFLFLFLLCFITLYLWILSKQSLNALVDQPLVSISQILALLGIVLMSFTILISTKITFIEKLLQGMDKAYGVHQMAGSLAFVFILSHPLLLVMQALPQAKLAASYLLPSQNVSYTLGILALYSMILPFVFMVFIKLPYNVWKLTHKFLGAAFLLGSVHALLVGSDIAAFLPLKIWLSVFIAIGISATIYSLFFYRRFGPKFTYEVEEIVRSIDTITICLRPKTDTILRFTPGQFVYVMFNNKKIGSELHPFSIASDPSEGYLRLSAKIVGDYTLNLSQFLEKGNSSTLYGPYGLFAQNSAAIKNSIWIAGGIGVTPFLSMLSYETKNPTDKSVHFYYTYSKQEEGTFINQIQDLKEKAPHVTFIDWCTQEKKRLNVEVIKRHLDLSKIDAIFLCGPLPMMEGLKKQFIGVGVSEQKIFYENFSFLS